MKVTINKETISSLLFLVCALTFLSIYGGMMAFSPYEPFSIGMIVIITSAIIGFLITCALSAYGCPERKPFYIGFFFGLVPAHFTDYRRCRTGFPAGEYRFFLLYTSMGRLHSSWFRFLGPCGCSHLRCFPPDIRTALSGLFSLYLFSPHTHRVSPQSMSSGESKPHATVYPGSGVMVSRVPPSP